MSHEATRSVQYTVVDAFTDRVFGGNPAAVIILDGADNAKLTGLNDDGHTLQLIAREFNLSETAFVTPKAPTSSSESIPTFGLRWFTPKDEVPLCGHATLASAHVLFSVPGVLPEDASLVHFETLSGALIAKRLDGGKIELKFPAGLATKADGALEEKAKRAVKNAVVEDHNVVFVGIGQGVSFKNFMLIELDAPFDLQSAAISPGALLDLAPDYQVIMLTASSHSASTHFVSRTFCPHLGIPEDPVTGSAHCMLGPYWHQKLRLQASEVMRAHQVSERGGVLDVIWDQAKNTCRLVGQAKTAIRGELFLPAPEI